MAERDRPFEGDDCSPRTVALQGKLPLVIVTGKIRDSTVQLSLELRHSAGYTGNRKGVASRNVAVLRGDVYRQELLSRFRRKPSPHPVAAFVAGFFGGRCEAIDGFFVCSQATETNGYLALDVVLERDFSAEGCPLTDRFRCLTMSLFDTAERLHESGWRFVFFFLWMLSWNPKTNHMMLVHLPFGAIYKPDEEQCNNGSTKLQPGNILQRKTSSACAADGRKLPATIDRKRIKDLLSDKIPTNLPAVNYSAEDLKSWWTVIVGKQTGMIVPEDCQFLYDEQRPIPNGALEGVVVKPDPDSLRVTDIQQIMLMIVRHFVGSRGGDWMKELRRLLDGARDVDEKFVDGVVRFLFPKADQQPLARRRFAWFVAMGLTQEDVRHLSSNMFPTLPVLTPDQEVLVGAGGGGIRMFAKLNVFPGDPEFERLARNALKGVKGVEELWQNPRQVLLRNQGSKGLGVFGEGVWEKGTFAMFYMARQVEVPSGRYIVSKEIGGHGPYADGAPCIELPMETFIERGTPGFFANAEKGAPNLSLSREDAFMYKNLWFFPMTVLRTFTDDYAEWHYVPEARRGMSCGDGAEREGAGRGCGGEDKVIARRDGARRGAARRRAVAEAGQ